jgi:hypothetical protein
MKIRMFPPIASVRPWPIRLIYAMLLLPALSIPMLLGQLSFRDWLDSLEGGWPY